MHLFPSLRHVMPGALEMVRQRSKKTRERFGIGIGIDEDTAAVVSPQDQLSVIGRGTVTIIDACQAQCLNPSTTPQGSPLAFSELIIHMLIAGDLFDLNHRTVISKEKAHENFRKSSLSRS